MIFRYILLNTTIPLFILAEFSSYAKYFYICYNRLHLRIADQFLLRLFFDYLNVIVWIVTCINSIYETRWYYHYKTIRIKFSIILKYNLPSTRRRKVTQLLCDDSNFDPIYQFIIDFNPLLISIQIIPFK